MKNLLKKEEREKSKGKGEGEEVYTSVMRCWKNKFYSCCTKRSIGPKVREVIFVYFIYSKMISSECLSLKGIQTN